MIELTGVRRKISRGFELDATCAFGGGITVLVGENGSGKSSLLRILATADRPHAGTYTFFGSILSTNRDVRDARRGVGWLPQAFGFEPSARVDEFLAYSAWLRGVARSEVRDASAKALEVVQLERVGERRMGELSGGMLRRVGIAQAVISSPRVLLLDEPTAGLDVFQRDRLHETLLKVAVGRVVVVTTHLLADVVALGHTALVIQDGLVWEPSLGGRGALQNMSERGFRDMLRSTPDEAHG